MPSTKKGSKKSSKKASGGGAGSSVFSSFTQQQIQEYKEGFTIMDNDRDGILSLADIRNAFDIIGKIVTEKELDEMMNDAPGPINFTMMLNMFAQRQSGGNDDDAVVIKAFKAFDNGEGWIDSEQFRMTLMQFGDKFNSKEVDDAFDQMAFNDDDSNLIDLESLIEMIVGKTEETEGEAPPAE